MTGLPPNAQLPGALDGVCVLDLTTGMAGALASMFLTDNGARVVRMVADNEPVVRSGPGFALWDRGKEAVILDMEDPNPLEKMAGSADVVIGDTPPGDEKHQAGQALSDMNPRLVDCFISAYGAHGPLKDEPADHDLVMARTGILSGQPAFREGPIHVVHPVASVGAGLLAALGIVSALYHRETTGAVLDVETSLMAGALMYSPKALGDNLKPRAFRMTPAGGGPFYSVFECADGEWIQLGCIHSGFVDLAAAALGIAHLMTDPEFGDGRYPRSEEARARLFDIVADAMRTRPASEWARIFEDADVPYAPAQTTDEAMDDPQIRHNNMVVKLDDPVLGRTSLAGLPIDLSRNSGRIQGPRVSSARQADDWLSDAVVQPSGDRRDRDDVDTGLPLEGIKVLEIANVIAGPFAGRLLADLGAEVVKLESLDGDISRPAGAAGFVFYNANKRSLSVNTRTPEGREIAQRVAGQSDVLLANMRPGATDRMGLSSKVVSSLNRQLIETHITAYGWTGPYAHRPGVDPLAQAITGLQRSQGGDGMPPMFLGRLAPCDYTGAALGALGTVLALFARERTGVAQKVDTNLLNAGAIMSADGFIRSAAKSPRPLTDKLHFGLSARHRLYQTSDGWIYLSGENDLPYQSLLTAAGWRDSSHDETSDDSQVHVSRDAEIASLLAQTIVRLTTQEAHQRFQRAAIPSAPVVQDYETAFYTDPQALANGHVSGVEHPTIGRLELAVNLVTFNGLKHQVRRATPLLGQHTAEVLSETGYTPIQVESLYRSKVVKTETPE